MKTLLNLSVFVTIVILLAMGCQKSLSDENSINVNKEFNTAFAKEWYYKTFQYTEEWKNSSTQNKKYVNWSSATTGRIGNLEFVEFPLVKASSSYSISRNNSLETAEIKKIAASSLSRIVFIKNPDGQIIVREVDYIPDLVFLQKKNYDISNTSFLKPNNDFTGRYIVKKWDGSIVSLNKYENGKITGVGTKNPIKNQPQNLICTTTEFCVWQQDCELVFYGDGMVTNECGPWYNTGDCWQETTCTGEGDPCQEYGIGCNPPPGGCDPTAVYPEETEFNSYVQMISDPAIMDAQITNAGSDPISGAFTWVVVKGAIANWEIKANTNYSYYHYRYYNTNTNAFEDNYDLFYFSTGNAYFTGSNTFITSTYTTTNPTTNQVLNNNTTYTIGKSHVIGTITHAANIPVRIPFCDPLTLNRTDDIDNTMNFSPK